MDEHRKKVRFFLKTQKERELFLLCKAKLGLNIGWPCVWAPLVMRKEGLLERRRNSSKALEKGKNPTNVTSAKSRDEYQGPFSYICFFQEQTKNEKMENPIWNASSNPKEISIFCTFMDNLVWFAISVCKDPFFRRFVKRRNKRSDTLERNGKRYNSVRYTATFWEAWSDFSLPF